MRVMAFDPGAARMGWAVLEDGPTYLGSDIDGLTRGLQESYQEFRMALIKYWSLTSYLMLQRWDPDVIVSEIVPVKGGGNFAIAGQSQLASTAITAVQSIAALCGYTFTQIGATTVKSKIAGNNKATKVRVRNSVLQIFPELHTKDWRKVFDEPDAIACGLAYLQP